jgi:hypothetical protein
MTQPSPKHQAADGSEVKAGQSWAYRAHQGDELAQVMVARLGTQRPARVMVQFTDEAFEGRQEWIPPARLKVLWQDVSVFRAREERWDRLAGAGLPLDDPREDAAETLIDLALREARVSLCYRGSGAIRISDPAALAANLGLDPHQLTGHPLAFTEDSELVVPWEVTELVITAAARRNPTPVLEYVAEAERKARRESIHGCWSGGRRSNDHHIKPEICMQVDSEYSRPRREVLRSWCGAEARDRFDELAELRKEIRRVGKVAESAIDALRSAGRQAEASRLQRELGTPVETLRDTAAPG